MLLLCVWDKTLRSSALEVVVTHLVENGELPLLGNREQEERKNAWYLKVQTEECFHPFCLHYPGKHQTTEILENVAYDYYS